VLGFSKTSTGDYSSAIYAFAAAYLLMMAVTGFVYLRRGSSVAGHRI